MGPTLRRDPILPRWTLIAPERAAKPELIEAGDSVCAFCAGQEHQTPHELFADRPPDSPADGPGWQVRVVPNRFPAARVDAEASAVPGERAGWGRHEVVIECPQHARDLADLPAEQIVRVVRGYRARLRVLPNDPQVRYIQLFKNHGAAAGASVPHPHAQILALDRVPPAVQAEIDVAEHAAACPWCAWMNAEGVLPPSPPGFAGGEGMGVRGGCFRNDDDFSKGESPLTPLPFPPAKPGGEGGKSNRIVAISQHHAAIVAFAGRFPYETWLLPLNHASQFATVDDTHCDDFANLLARVLTALVRAADAPPYNLLLHTAPNSFPSPPHFHWHWELLPRVTGTAGYEWATGDAINPLPPEEAARRLRHHLPD